MKKLAVVLAVAVATMGLSAFAMVVPVPDEEQTSSSVIESFMSLGYAESATIIERLMLPVSEVKKSAVIIDEKIFDNDMHKKTNILQQYPSAIASVLVLDTIQNLKVPEQEKMQLIKGLFNFIRSDAKEMLNDNALCPVFQAAASRVDISVDELISAVAQTDIGFFNAHFGKEFSERISTLITENPELVAKMITDGLKKEDIMNALKIYYQTMQNK